MIPIARLAIEYFPVNPLKPCGIMVLADDGKAIAVIEIDELKRTYQRILELENVKK